MRSSSYKLSLAILTKWLVPHYIIDSKSKADIQKWILYYDKWLQRIYRNNGLLELINQSKTCRLLVLRYLGGDPLLVSTTRIRIHKDGLPWVVKPIRRMLQQRDPDQLRLILTVLNLTKSIDDESVPFDLTPITAPGTYNPLKMEEYMNMVPNILSTHFGLNPESVEYTHKQFHLSAKSAPNGGPALGACIDELPLIFKNQTLFTAICMFGGKYFAIKMLSLYDAWSEKFHPEHIQLLRKLFVVNDKEAKSRIVAILDYWSQTVLKPLHESIFKILRKIESDMTFEQSAFIDYIDKYKPKKFWCYDLSNATDRFPIVFQKAVLNYLLGEEPTSSWEIILTGQDFRYTPDKKSDPINVKYAVGQPMGAYSSWPVFTLSHHVVMLIAAQIAGVSYKGAYVLLGDDIVIFNEKLAVTYLKVMTDIGVEISLSKSIVSEDLCSFAARYFYKGVEISPFSLRGLHESCKSPSELAEFIKTMVRNGWSGSDLDITPESLVELISLVYPRHHRKMVTANQAYFLSSFSIRELLEGGLVQYPLSMIIDCHSQVNASQKLRDVLHLVFLADYKSSTLKKMELVKDWWKHLKLDHFFETELIRLNPEIKNELLFILPIMDVCEQITTDFHAITFRYEIFGSPDELITWNDMKEYRSLNIVPDPKVALKKRNHASINQTQSNLLIKAVHVCTTQNVFTYISDNTRHLLSPNIALF